MVSHGASERLTEADQNWIQCRLMLILMLMFMTMAYIEDDADVDVDVWIWWLPMLIIITKIGMII